MKIEEFLRFKFFNPTHNEDCSEIAEDFYRMNPSGRIVTVTSPRDPRFNTFKMIERGNLKDFHYHCFYFLKGFVFDPSMSPTPVPYSEYRIRLQSLNSLTLTYRDGVHCPF